MLYFSAKILIKSAAGRVLIDPLRPVLRSSRTKLHYTQLLRLLPSRQHNDFQFYISSADVRISLALIKLSNPIARKLIKFQQWP